MRAIPFFQDKKAGPAQEKTCTPCPCAHDLAAACHRVQPLTSQLSAPSSPSRLCRWASCRGLTLTLALPPSPTLTLALTLNQVGFVQGRWTYLNADESLFCRYQANPNPIPNPNPHPSPNPIPNPDPHPHPNPNPNAGTKRSASTRTSSASSTRASARATSLTSTARAASGARPASTTPEGGTHAPSSRTW